MALLLRTRRAFRGFFAIALMGSPVALSTVYLASRRYMPGLPYEADYQALAFVVLIGCAGAALLPISRRARILTFALYLPAIMFIVVGWSLGFICAVYGMCP